MDLKEYTDFRNDDSYKKFQSIYNATVQIEKALAKQENAPEKLSEMVYKQIVEEPTGINVKDIQKLVKDIEFLHNAKEDSWLGIFELEAISDRNILEIDLQEILLTIKLSDFADLLSSLNTKFKDILNLIFLKKLRWFKTILALKWLIHLIKVY